MTGGKKKILFQLKCQEFKASLAYRERVPGQPRLHRETLSLKKKKKKKGLERWLSG